jgi:hypothetical protein
MWAIMYKRKKKMQISKNGILVELRIIVQVTQWNPALRYLIRKSPGFFDGQ